MIQQVYFYIQQGTDPFHNLAMERFLLETVPENSCILYLWQNANTVVIGRNQNCWQECKLQALEQDGGTMVRRLSGGGAVYHDLGNLNFTFLVPKADYDVSRQLEVILQALHQLGIPAEKSGRNDLLAEGRKFSGNAFYDNGTRCYHHGTLMVQVNREKLGQYLQVSASKLASKGVASVQSRVVNLQELQPTLTIAQLEQALVAALEPVYGVAAQPYPEAWLQQEQIAVFETEFRSARWRFGRRIPFTWEMEHRFSWGNVQLQCQISGGIITQLALYSDAMDAALVQQMAQQLQGSAFRSEAMASRLQEIAQRQEAADLAQHLLSLAI